MVRVRHRGEVAWLAFTAVCVRLTVEVGARDRTDVRESLSGAHVVDPLIFVENGN